jgi:hypothetical protein
MFFFLNVAVIYQVKEVPSLCGTPVFISVHNSLPVFRIQSQMNILISMIKLQFFLHNGSPNGNSGLKFCVQSNITLLLHEPASSLMNTCETNTVRVRI